MSTFKLTFNKPAVRQLFEIEGASGVRMKMDGPTVLFQPSSNTAQPDYLPLSPRTRGGFEVVVDGRKADELLSRLKNEHGPFFIVRRAPAPQSDWFNMVPFEGRDAPPKFDPHVRLWLKDQPSAFAMAAAQRDENEEETPNLTLGDVETALAIIQAHATERRPGRTPKDVTQAREIVRSFEGFVERVMPSLLAKTRAGAAAPLEGQHSAGPPATRDDGLAAVPQPQGPAPAHTPAHTPSGSPMIGAGANAFHHNIDLNAVAQTFSFMGALLSGQLPIGFQQPAAPVAAPHPVPVPPEPIRETAREDSPEPAPPATAPVPAAPAKAGRKRGKAAAPIKPAKAPARRRTAAGPAPAVPETAPDPDPEPRPDPIGGPRVPLSPAAKIVEPTMSRPDGREPAAEPDFDEDAYLAEQERKAREALGLTGNRRQQPAASPSGSRPGYRSRSSEVQVEYKNPRDPRNNRERLSLRPFEK